MRRPGYRANTHRNATCHQSTRPIKITGTCVRRLRGELAQNVDIDHKDELLDRLQRVAVNHALQARGLGDRVRVALLRGPRLGGGGETDSQSVRHTPK